MTDARNLGLFIVAITAAFVYICNVIPQIQSGPVAAETTTIGGSPEELVAAGEQIFMSDRAQCLTCHSLGEDPKARCPNQEGLGARASERKPGLGAAEYLVESVYNPNAFIVSGYPKNQMTPVDKPPIALSHEEILAVLTYLNSLGGKTDAELIDELRKIQDPWRRGLLKAEEAAERARLPIFPGDPARGQEVFEGQGCIRCHRLGSVGRDVGPELTAIGASQTADYILESILDPSAVIVKGYKETIVMWKEEGRRSIRGTPVAWIPDEERPRVLRLSIQEADEVEEREIDLSQVARVGDTTMGVKVNGETEFLCGEYVEGDKEAGVTLRLFEDGHWVERRFPAEAIEHVNFPYSPMPANYAELMTPREIYDLLAYQLEQKGQP